MHNYCAVYCVCVHCLWCVGRLVLIVFVLAFTHGKLIGKTRKSYSQAHAHTKLMRLTTLVFSCACIVMLQSYFASSLSVFCLYVEQRQRDQSKRRICININVATLADTCIDLLCLQCLLKCVPVFCVIDNNKQQKKLLKKWDQPISVQCILWHE